MKIEIPNEIIETAQIVAAARLGVGCRNPKEFEKDMEEAERLERYIGQMVASILIKEIHGTTILSHLKIGKTFPHEK